MTGKLVKLGWKNVWRNPTRSGVVVIAVLLGTWAGIFISAFYNGMIQDYLKNELELSVGHVQVMHENFKDLYNPKFYIRDAGAIIDTLERKPYADTIREESLVTGLAQSAVSSFGVTIHGIDTVSDSLHPLNKYVAQGAFLEGVTRNPAMVGKSLSERLNLDLQSKVILNFQDVNGNITAGSFRVAGIFDTYNDRYEESNVFVRGRDLNDILGQEQLIHKITLQITDYTQANRVVAELRQQYPDLDISSWGEAAPELQYVFDIMDITLYVIMVIIIIALVFSIINTMLMAVMERTRELGMLMALGMNQSRLFFMILAETFFLTMVGTPLGLAFSWMTISYFEHVGINLGAFAEGLNAYGFGTIIHPSLHPEYYLNITLMIAAASFISALYPAWKTMQLNPVEAIRKI